MSEKRGKKRHADKHDDEHESKKPHAKYKDSIDKNKRGLSAFLQDRLNISDPHDFWRFFEKYHAIQSRNDHPELNRQHLIPINFDTKLSKLYDRLPSMDHQGERLDLDYRHFCSLMQALLVYQDFQLKTKFDKLKQLRRAQKELPIAQAKQEIIDTLKEARVVLIAGDTGCGKSTQVPQYVLEAGYNKVVCTQPRRIACVSLAKRVAHETLTDYKSTVGYQIRFEKTKRADTAIIFMTEGLLLRQASEEDTLNSYDVIILDEVHERHLYGDFLVGIMKCLLYKRADFKLILMSATINIDLFSAYFAAEQIKVIQVPGRLYPIDIRYNPIRRDPYERKATKFDSSPYLQIVQMIDQKYPPNQKGDLLVFLNGFSEISALAGVVEEYSKIRKNWIVLQLHSTLSLEEQDKVFDYPPEGVRKCIISTNIAETSVTIDGIRFVIDSGKVNRMMYTSGGGINRLAECCISQDSAKQRAGRAGRTGPGICYRLYSETDFNQFDAFTTAEIHLVPLESLVLHMISLGLSNIAHFPFLERPSEKSIEEAVEKLKFAGALVLSDDALALTPLGDALSRLPVELTVGKMLIMSTVFGNVSAILALAAILSVQSPVTQHGSRNMDTIDARKPLESNHGDPITILNIYKEWLIVKQETTPTSGMKQKETSKMWARKRGLEEQRFYEITKLVQQFRDILVDATLLPKIANEQLTGSERAIRHGELKQLRTLRRELKNQTTQRKQLKYRQFDVDVHDVCGEPKFDIRDIEFRISNDFKKLQQLLDDSSPESYKELMMLKLILTSGLYPQVAVEDDFNYSKTVADRLYHTKNKNFVFLRPMSAFANQPEILELHNDDIEVPPPGYFSKRPISRKHQILIYQSILETKRVFLVNVLRMPALQTLMLFAKTIATNRTLTQFVFDDFLAVDVPHFGQGQTLLKRAIDLRTRWKAKLEEKLRNEGDGQHSDPYRFIEELIRFMVADVSYNIRRLLPADLKVIYTHRAEDLPPDHQITNPFERSFAIVPNEHVGGMQVTENVVYDCLVEEEWSNAVEMHVINASHDCAHCHESLTNRSVFQVMQHEDVCNRKDDVEPKKEEDTPAQTIKANARHFHCDACNQDLLLNPVDIIKHRKTCVQPQQQEEKQ